jgi:hypothetical protein
LASSRCSLALFIDFRFIVIRPQSPFCTPYRSHGRCASRFSKNIGDHDRIVVESVDDAPVRIQIPNP